MKKEMVVAVLVLSGLFCGEHLDAPATEQSPTVRYQVEAVWTKECVTERGYVLIDPAALSIPDNLVGTLIDSIGNLYVCDALTEELCMLDRQGNLVYCVGSVGEGPEDHRGLGEPVVWRDRHIARADCAVSSKFIIYSSGGDYEDSIDLIGWSQFNRIFTTSRNTIGIGVDLSGSPLQGMDAEIYIGLIDSYGVVTKSLLTSSRSLPPNQPGVQLKEEDFWLLPRVAVGADGRVFVQSDLYSNVLTCYDADLNHLWTITGKWPAQKRSDDELKDAKLTLGLIQPAVKNQSLVRIVPRSSGEVWVEAAASGYNWKSEEVVFDVIDSRGIVNGMASLSGLPAYPGRFKIFGDFLVWMIDPDFDCADGEMPSIGVFRIVKSSV